MTRLLFVWAVFSAAQVSAADSVTDRFFAERWAELSVKPAPTADDATYLRRVSLDLLGRIPTVQEVRGFLADAASDKRAKLVDKLLASPESATHFARVWRGWLLPDPNVNLQSVGFAPPFEAWLRGKFTANARYDGIARELIVATVAQQTRRLGMFQQMDAGGGGAALFAQALENKPENLAGQTARLFLGIKLECAQCHDHPHAPWTQDQFWGYAAYFSNRSTGMRIPNSDKTAPPRLPGSAAEVKPVSRQTVADWLTKPDNPYFARAAVNRLWAYFFGPALLEPFDDFQEQSSALSPLLDDLAKEFAAGGFDLRQLMRGIVLSRVYQLASRPPTADEPSDAFARGPVKGLSADQALDSLAVATGLQPTPAARAEFLSRYGGGPERPAKAQTSLLQALTLMNGRLVIDATSIDRGATFAAIADAPFFSTAEKIETLYLAALGRTPRPAEAKRLAEYVETGGPRGERTRALADVFWSLLNSGEFALNH